MGNVLYSRVHIVCRSKSLPIESISHANVIYFLSWERKKNASSHIVMRLEKNNNNKTNDYKVFSSERNDGFCSPCIRTSEQSSLIVADIVGRV